MSNRCTPSPVASPVPGRSAAAVDGSSSSGEYPRARFLNQHGASVANCTARNRTSVTHSETFTPRERDSANFRAALELRRLRENAALTQEQLAEVCNTTPKTIRDRENAKVDLGALKQRQRLVEIARQKYLQEEAKRK